MQLTTGKTRRDDAFRSAHICRIQARTVSGYHLHCMCTHTLTHTSDQCSGHTYNQRHWSCRCERERFAQTKNLSHCLVRNVFPSIAQSRRFYFVARLMYFSFKFVKFSKKQIKIWPEFILIKWTTKQTNKTYFLFSISQSNFCDSAKRNKLSAPKIAFKKPEFYSIDSVCDWAHGVFLHVHASTWKMDATRWKV